MDSELPPDDDNSEVLEKLDALMRKHQQPTPPKPAAPSPTLLAPTLPQATPHSEDDGIPTLTDVVDRPTNAIPNSMADPDSAVRSLEESLQLELETRIAPQLSLAFQQALDELLQDAKRQISITVREHLEKEMQAHRAQHPD